MNLGGNIAQLRKSSNLTQLQLAEKLNVSCQLIEKWEKNETTPDLYTLILISKIYNVTVDELVKEKKENESENHKINIEAYAEKSWEIYIKTIMFLCGFISILVSIVAVMILAVFDEALASLKYMIYRYYEVGELVNAPISNRIPFLAFIVIFCSGLFCIIISIKFQKKK